MRFPAATLLALLAPALNARAQTDSIPDTPMSDTLRTVIVTEGGRLPIGISDAARERIAQRSLGDVIGQGALDKMMHPFAVKQRKKERHKRKMQRALIEYNRVKKSQELLIATLRNEGIYTDSINNAHLSRQPAQEEQ